MASMYSAKVMEDVYKRQHLHRTGIVHRTEVQQHPAPFSRRGSKGAVVVLSLIHI